MNIGSWCMYSLYTSSFSLQQQADSNNAGLIRAFLPFACPGMLNEALSKTLNSTQARNMTNITFQCNQSAPKVKFRRRAIFLGRLSVFGPRVTTCDGRRSGAKSHAANATSYGGATTEHAVPSAVQSGRPTNKQNRNNPLFIEQRIQRGI